MWRTYTRYDIRNLARLNFNTLYVECPRIHSETDGSTYDLASEGLPSQEQLSRFLNVILILHLTASKSYSSHTRIFLTSLSDVSSLKEHAIAAILKDPKSVAQHAHDQLQSETRSASPNL